MDDEIDFCSLGMFIIDDIYPPPSSEDQQPQLNVAGGAGTYSAIGARLLCPPPLSQRVGWVVDLGTDFPAELLRVIQSWDTGVLLRKRDGLTTKGWNGYGENEHRAFKYLTPKLRIHPDDLPPKLLRSKSFHLICTSQRCQDMYQALLRFRSELDADLPQPIIIWEPVPDCCTPDELPAMKTALQYVDVISPNHAELAAIFDAKANTPAGDVDRKSIEECTRQILSLCDHKEKHLSAVIRCGKDGCYIASSEPDTKSRWIPAVHDSNSRKVIDPTGGGNGFLGGFAIGLARTDDILKATICGSISASLCIEQVGVPSSTEPKDGYETWNGVVVQERLNEFCRRCDIDVIEL